jgi:hypothetical protein
MVVRAECSKLQKRFRDLVTISAVMAMLASGGIALMNGAFIEIWTSGKVTWAPWNNFLLACVLFTTAVTRCHTSLVGITKQVRGMKFVYLFEGLAFVTLSVLLVPRIGLTGLLIAALVCNMAITGTYGVGRTAGYFGISRLAVTGWIARPAGILLSTAGLFLCTRIPALAGLDASFRLGIGVTLFCIAVLPALWFFGLDRGLHSELAGASAKICRNAKSKLGMT